MKLLNAILLICCQFNVISTSSVQKPTLKAIHDLNEKRLMEHTKTINDGHEKMLMKAKKHGLDAMNKYVSTLSTECQKTHASLLDHNPIIQLHSYCTNHVNWELTQDDELLPSSEWSYKALCLMAADDATREAVFEAGKNFLTKK